MIILLEKNILLVQIMREMLKRERGRQKRRERKRKGTRERGLLTVKLYFKRFIVQL